MNFNDRTVLITGAARRIGRAIAISLAESGANVIVHYRTSEDEALDLSEQIQEKGVKAWLVRADLKRDWDLNRLLPEAIEKAGRIDYLINNAGIFPSGSLEELELNQLSTNIQINSWAPFYLARAFKQSFDRGKIINLLDTRVAGYDWKHAGYYVSKVILARLTKMMAIKFSPDFTVNGVAPGLILPPEGLGEEYLEKRTDRVPLQKHGKENDVAEAVSYLLDSSFVTGQIIYVDGGRNLLHELEG